METEPTEKEHKKIVNQYDNSSAELPTLQISISQELENHIVSTHLIARAHKYKDCERGIDYLMNKHKQLSKKKSAHKYNGREFG